MKRIRLFIYILLLILFIFLGFLLCTESGLRVARFGLYRFSAGKISIGEVRGRFLGDWALTDINLATSEVGVRVDELEWSWRPLKLFSADLHLRSLLASRVRVELRGGATTSDSTGPIQLPNTLLPFGLVVEQLSVDDLKIVGHDGENLISLDRIRASFQVESKRLSVNHFAIDGTDIGLAMHGNINVQRGWLLDLLGTWHLAGYGFHPMRGTFSTAGTLKELRVELGIHTPADIRVAGNLQNLLDNPQWTARLDGRGVDLSTWIISCPKIDLAWVKGDLTGDFGHYLGMVKAEGTWDNLQDMQLVIDLNGDGLGIDFPTLHISLGDGVVQAKQAKISWQDIFSWQGRFNFTNVDSALINKTLPGRLNADFINTGEVKRDGLDISFKGIRLDGVLRGQSITTVGDVFLNEDRVYTDGLIVRNGEGNGAAYIKEAMFSWRQNPSWSGEITLDAFNLAWLHTSFLGSVNGSILGEGGHGDDGLEANIKIGPLSGTLWGESLSGGGEINILADSLQDATLLLQNGSSKLVVQGKVGDYSDINLQISTPNIGRFIPQSGGSLLLRGSLQGKRDSPQIDVEFAGTGLRYKENSLDDLRGELHTELAGDNPVSGSIIARDSSIFGFLTKEVKIDVLGSLQDHEIEVGVSAAMGELLLKARGSYLDLWQGEISQFQLQSSDYGLWQQQDIATVAIGSKEFRLEKFCLTEGTGAICLAGSLQLEDGLRWTVQGSFDSVPLNWINRLKLTTVPINGMIQADIAATGDGLWPHSVKARARLPEVDFVLDAAGSEAVPHIFDDTVLTFDLVDNLFKGHFYTNMANGGRVVLLAEIEDAGDFSAPLGPLAVRGSLELQECDLGQVTTYSNYVMEPTGRLNSSLSFAGTLGQPLIHGKISIENGGIVLPYQGINLEDINLFVEVDREGAKVNGMAKSGPGQLTVAGKMSYPNDAGLEGELYIGGSEFLLLDLPEYTARINPDIQFIFSKTMGKIKGKIEVPYGLIAPEKIDNSIGVSEDVVFTDNIEEEQSRQAWPVFLDLDVQLGDDVRIDGYGLTSRLGGGLYVKSTAEGVLTGRGQLNLIDGTFTVHDRTLDIKRGHVLFNGGPLDNPGVDVRAQVEVAEAEAKDGGYTVGMDISGLVQDLQYNLFSDPYMEDTEILAYMIVGHSLVDSSRKDGGTLALASKALGVGAGSIFVQEFDRIFQLDDIHLEGSSKKEDVTLVLGKRLTKDLYIGYDMSTFSRLGRFRVSYDLAHGFSVETRSSSEATGADLLYSFKR